MPVHTGEVKLSTRGDADVVDITGELERVVGESGASEGLATAFVRGSTAAVTTMEYEPGGVADLKDLLDRLIPAQGDYEHNRLNHDTNSHAHQRASLIGSSEQVPIAGGRPRPRDLAAGGPDRLRRPAARAHGPRPGALVSRSDERIWMAAALVGAAVVVLAVFAIAGVFSGDGGDDGDPRSGDFGAISVPPAPAQASPPSSGSGSAADPTRSRPARASSGSPTRWRGP